MVCKGFFSCLKVGQVKREGLFPLGEAQLPVKKELYGLLWVWKVEELLLLPLHALLLRFYRVHFLFEQPAPAWVCAGNNVLLMLHALINLLPAILPRPLVRPLFGGYLLLVGEYSVSPLHIGAVAHAFKGVLSSGFTAYLLKMQDHIGCMFQQRFIVRYIENWDLR